MMPEWSALRCLPEKNSRRDVSRITPGRRMSRSTRPRACKKLSWRNAQVSHETHPRHHLERVISRINLPPVKTLPDRSHVMVVIVVPALAASPQGYPEIVST